MLRTRLDAIGAKQTSPQIEAQTLIVDLDCVSRTRLGTITASDRTFLTLDDGPATKTVRHHERGFRKRNRPMPLSKSRDSGFQHRVTSQVMSALGEAGADVTQGEAGD